MAREQFLMNDAPAHLRGQQKNVLVRIAKQVRYQQKVAVSQPASAALVCLIVAATQALGAPRTSRIRSDTQSGSG